jgi:hypothetical protein
MNPFATISLRSLLAGDPSHHYVVERSNCYILRDNKAPAARFGLEKREHEGLEYFAFRP